MFDLVELRPAPAATRPAVPASSRPGRPTAGASTGWRGRAAAWLRRRVAVLGPGPPGDPAVAELADLASRAREPDEVRVALVRLAAEVSGAARVELFRDRSWRSVRRLALWPPNALSESAAEPGSSLRGPIARSREKRAALPTLTVALEAGAICFGMLRLTSSGRPWPAGAAPRLATLCAIAALAERGLLAPTRAGSPPRDDHESGLQGSMILGAFLTFAHAQARRRHEPLSLLEVSIDRLGALRELLGADLSEAAVDRVARSIRATIRASDVLARLEDGRLAVLLPNASAENALRVAEAIRAAIARAGTASTTMPTLTASIGVATFPDHAPDLATLRAAAATALTRAESLGHNRIAEAVSIARHAHGQLDGPGSG